MDINCVSGHVVSTNVSRGPSAIVELVLCLVSITILNNKLL